MIECALRIGQEKEDAEWLHNSAVKAQMKRMDPSFSEKALGFKSFSDFLRFRSDLVDLVDQHNTHSAAAQPHSPTIAIHPPTIASALAGNPFARPTKTSAATDN